jgi:hypothetical protein
LANEATQQLPGSARGSVAPADRLTAEPAWLLSATGAVGRNTVGRPSARSLGVVAQEGSGCRPCRRHSVRVLGQRPASSVRCERQCPRVPVRAIRVRCPVSGAGVRASRCPMSNVPCPCVPAHPGAWMATLPTPDSRRQLGDNSCRARTGNVPVREALKALSADSSRRSRATRRVGCSDSPDGYHAVGIKPLASPCRPHDHHR